MSGNRVHQCYSYSSGITGYWGGALKPRTDSWAFQFHHVSSSFPTWQTIPNHVFRSLSSPTGTQPYAIVQSMISLKMLRMVHRPHPNLYAKKEIGTTTNPTMSSSSHVLPRFALDSRHSEGFFPYTHVEAQCIQKQSVLVWSFQTKHYKNHRSCHLRVWFLICHTLLVWVFRMSLQPKV